MTADALIKKLKRKGWYFVRQNSSHVIFKHPENPNNISIPWHGKDDIAKGTLNDILKIAGLK
jgi:predicted RNA binding protein YcfA (HicA-like mRNA interferase family)